MHGASTVQTAAHEVLIAGVVRLSPQLVGEEDLRVEALPLGACAESTVDVGDGSATEMLPSEAGVFRPCSGFAFLTYAYKVGLGGVCIVGIFLRV